MSLIRGKINYGTFFERVKPSQSSTRETIFSPFLEEKKVAPGPSDQSFERPAPPLPKFEEDCCPATIPNDAMLTGSLIARDFHLRGDSRPCLDSDCFNCCTIKTNLSADYPLRSELLGDCHVVDCFADSAEYYLHVLPQRWMHVQAWKYCGTNYESAQCCDWDRACCVLLCCVRVPCGCCAGVTKCIAGTVGCIPNVFRLALTEEGWHKMPLARPAQVYVPSDESGLTRYVELPESERQRALYSHDYLCRTIVEDEQGTIPFPLKIAALSLLAKSPSGKSILSFGHFKDWIVDEKEIPRMKDNLYVKIVLNSKLPESPKLLELMLDWGQANKFLSPEARTDLADYFDRIPVREREAPPVAESKYTPSASSAPSAPSDSKMSEAPTLQSKETLIAKAEVLKKFKIISGAYQTYCEFPDLLFSATRFSRPVAGIVREYTLDRIFINP